MKSIIFDLDNTLYDSREFFVGSFQIVTNYISDKYNISKDEMTYTLIQLLNEQTSMYSHMFDDLIKIHNIPLKELHPMIRLFNDSSVDISPYADTIPTLKKIKERDLKIGLVTDGDVSRQRRKLKLLKINEYFDVAVFTKESKPKPSHIPFEQAALSLGLKPQDCVYVGDNPFLDFKGSKKAGMQTIRLLRGEFKKIKETSNIDMTIDTLDQLVSIIDKS